ncbi:hypothetical protein GJ496_003485 [Pomphorhynchus laevis]|nr:hypothetical protein GJ496_003485 [Pomphorhynchus laevis]
MKSMIETFSIVSYNVLSQKILERTKHLYNGIHPVWLAWTTRRNLIFSTILQTKGDIICLQEVEEDDYYQEMLPLFEAYGYRGLYKRGTLDKTDGCAVLYKNSFLNLVEWNTVEMYRPNQCPLLNRNNIAIIARFAFEHKLKQTFVVSTTHLLYNPKRCDVRLAQLQLLLSEIARFSPDSQESIILCGDFNFEPDSDLYDFIIGNGLNPANATLKVASLSKWKQTKSESLYRSFPLELASVCMDLSPSYQVYDQKKESISQRCTENDNKQAVAYNTMCFQSAHRYWYINPVNFMNFQNGFQHKLQQYTTLQADIKHCRVVDYIFFSNSRSQSDKSGGTLELVAISPLPAVNNTTQPMPCGYNGSDHMYLQAFFTSTSK